MGRPKIKVYQYGSDFKFLRSYDTQSEVFNKYFEGKKGRLFPDNKDYRELPDGTYISTYRIGRKLSKLLRIDNSVYCSKNATDKEIEVFNLLGEKVAEFKNIRVLIGLTKKDQSTVLTSIKRSKSNSTPHQDLKYKIKSKDSSIELLERIESETTDIKVANKIREFMKKNKIWK